ncbi:hypothetical protein [Roseomonas sp. BN140053]|uniref:hypothetical protein n=1 Tax=Roseomonas sp. BN140053 TaxID=3391898 RepID=UPI0039EA70AD
MSVMGALDHYGRLASAARASAAQVPDNPSLQDAFERLAESYDRLSRQVRRIRLMQENKPPGPLLLLLGEEETGPAAPAPHPLPDGEPPAR